MQCANRRAIASDKAEGRVILHDIELATRDAPEHKTAAAAGVDNSKEAALEVETAPYRMVVGFRRRGSSGDWKMRNEGRRIPISRLHEKCCRLAALGDGYRHRHASRRLDLVGGRYQPCISCLKGQWTCGNSLCTWKSRHLGRDSKFGAKGDAMDDNQRSAMGIPSRTSPGF
jgi:hypothetical protein